MCQCDKCVFVVVAVAKTGAQPVATAVSQDEEQADGKQVEPSTVSVADYTSTQGFLEIKGSYQYGGKPLWWHPAFVGMFTDPYIKNTGMKNHIDGMTAGHSILNQHLRLRANVLIYV